MVVLLLAIYSMVIIACLKLGKTDLNDDHYRAPRSLPFPGLIGNLLVLAYTVIDDPPSLIWCAGLVGIGVALFLFEDFFGTRDRPADADRDEPIDGKGA